MGRLLRSFSSLIMYAIILLVVTAAGGTALYIYLVHIIGRAEVQVPNVIGMEATNAIALVYNAGLTLSGIEEQYSAVVQPGCILEQNPLPNTAVRKGRGVRLTKSMGYEEVEVPSVLGQLLDEADSNLMRAGVRMGRKSETHHAQVPSGRVIMQDPAVGQKGQKGMDVNVLVSLGPPQSAYVMPNVTGFKKAQALEGLRALGFSRIEVQDQSDPNSPPDIVLNQDPAQGAESYLSSQILLTVSRTGDAASPQETPTTSSAPPGLEMPTRKTEPFPSTTEISPDAATQAPQATDTPKPVPTATVKAASTVQYHFVYPLPRPRSVGWVEVKLETKSETKTVYTGVHSRGGLIEFDTFAMPGDQLVVYQDGQKVGSRTVEASQ